MSEPNVGAPQTMRPNIGSPPLEIVTAYHQLLNSDSKSAADLHNVLTFWTLPLNMHSLSFYCPCLRRGPDELYMNIKLFLLSPWPHIFAQENIWYSIDTLDSYHITPATFLSAHICLQNGSQRPTSVHYHFTIQTHFWLFGAIKRAVWPTFISFLSLIILLQICSIKNLNILWQE